MPDSTTVSKCLAHWGTPHFEAEFLEELSERDDALPLQDLCQSGTPSGWPEIYDLNVSRRDGHTVHGSFAVSFTETSRTGCRDIDWKETVKGRIDFTLNLDDGQVIFENPRPKREYDPEEF